MADCMQFLSETAWTDVKFLIGLVFKTRLGFPDIPNIVVISPAMIAKQWETDRERMEESKQWTYNTCNKICKTFAHKLHSSKHSASGDSRYIRQMM